jgi:glucan phosphoethanolaminetransferase (alkaline phosphatase superfamily)
VPHNLFLKILLICLLFLFGLLILPEFEYNRTKFFFNGIGFLVLSVLFLIAGYLTSLTYMIILTCILVAFLYCSKILFNTTFGEVIFSTQKTAQVKILDPFHNLNKIYTIETTKKLNHKAIVSLKLDNTIFRKPIAVIDVICDNSKILPKVAKLQKIKPKQIKARKNTSISKKKRNV